MDINDTAAFLVGTLLIGLSFCLMGVMVLFLNNMFAKFWKPINWKIENMFSDYSPMISKKEKKTEKTEETK